MDRSHHRRTIGRREFLQVVGGAAAATSLGAACRFAGATTPQPPTTATGTPFLPEVPTLTGLPAPTPSATPVTPTPESLVGRVALIRTTERTQGVQRALDLLGINPVQGKTVFLKPNFNSADPAPASTHPDTLRTLIQWLQEKGAQHITVGDRSGQAGGAGTRGVMQAKGTFDLASELGFEVIDFDELGPDGWLAADAPDSHWRRGFFFARPCVDAGAVVQTCNLKTHRFGGHFTLSLKNAVGLAAKYVPGLDYNFMDELHNLGGQRLKIAELNTAYSPALIVLDGVEAFTTGGPDVGKRVEAGVVLAGVDRVAIDAVGVAILRDLGTTPEVSRGRVFDQQQIARAVELGLGVSLPEGITLLSDDADGRAFADHLRPILEGAGS